MRVGAHVSAAGGLDKAIDRAVEIGAETLQLFCSPPQGWAFKPVPPEMAEAFREKAAANSIDRVFLHGVYLVNLGTENPVNLKRGIESLTNHMHTASAIGAVGVIFHPGSHKGRGYDAIFQQTVDAISQVLTDSPDDAWLIIENMAGMGNHIGARFQELGLIIQAVGSPRVKICMDVQHAFAAGYDIVTPDGIGEAMEEFDREIGLSNLVAVHANDSKKPLASGVDRHENIGQGEMGLQGFQVIMGHPAFRDVPFLLEVPGMEGNGPDRENLDILKELRAKVGLKE
ncbi:MAG: deoxyribonuclease IV [Chloroflexi bacterium]|nr:deoxyribonuclease IV [Chloroflexota bacterium]